MAPDALRSFDLGGASPSKARRVIFTTLAIVVALFAGYFVILSATHELLSGLANQPSIAEDSTPAQYAESLNVSAFHLFCSAIEGALGAMRPGVLSVYQESP